MGDSDAAALIGLLQQVARRIGADFESRYGYPPGTNEVVMATGDQGLRLLRDELGGRVPGQMAAFFEQVSEVSLPDLWNGYFIGPPDWMVGVYASAEPRFVRFEDTDQEVVVVASNGGGFLYAAPLPTGEPIFALPNDEILKGVYSSTSSGFGPVALDFNAFLRRLADAALQGGADPFGRW